MKLVPMPYALLLVAMLGSCAVDRSPSGPGDWPVHGGDPGGMKYSPLIEINRDTVGQLQVAWTWEPGEAPIPGPRQPIPGQDVRPGAFETTPIVLDGTMYLSTPYNRVVALNPETGQEIWVYDPRTIEWGQPPNGTGYVHRGVAIWRGPSESRIFLNSRWRLIALDAKTGLPIDSFGHQGEIDLTENLLWPTNRLHYTQTSPPVIYEDLVILGNGVWDGFIYRRDPPGNVQAFDVRTGDLVWNFNLIPQPGEVGNETWEDDSWDRTGHTNVWAPFSLDTELGYLYLPVGTPSNDYYGGHRKGDNLFAESLLCLNARTGERVWHFQAVHHGLWDYDLGSPPALLTVTVEGRTIDVVAAPSKMGFVYVFDRKTGDPVWPIEERPVPPSDVSGERAGSASAATCEPARSPAGSAAPSPPRATPNPPLEPEAAGRIEGAEDATAQPGILVASLDQLRPGSAQTASYKGLPVIVINESGKLRAVSGICTHENCEVEWRGELGIIQCPCHDGRFDTRGKVLSGPPPAPLLEFKTVIEGDRVYIVKPGD